MRHLGEALDKVRKAEYALLSHPQNLKLLLAANTRLHAAYLLKESFGQLWDYSSEAWARKFFDNWRAPLKWRRLAPYERFALHESSLFASTKTCDQSPLAMPGCQKSARGGKPGFSTK